MKVVANGQTGISIAALSASRRMKISTSGCCPAGYMTEAGPQEAILKGYNLYPHPSSELVLCDLENINRSDVTLLISSDVHQSLRYEELLQYMKQKQHTYLSFSPDELIDASESSIPFQMHNSNNVLHVLGDTSAANPTIAQAMFPIFLKLFRNLILQPNPYRPESGGAL